MKGISTIIVTILILMISISLTSLGYVTFSSFFSKMTNAGDQAISQTISNMLAQMRIESVTRGAAPPDTAVYVRNTGKVDLTNFSAYDDDAYVPTNPATPAGGKIAPGEVKNVNITTLVAAGSVIKITTAQGAVAIQQVP